MRTVLCTPPPLHVKPVIGYDRKRPWSETSMLNLNPARAASLARCLKTALLLLAMGMTVLLAAAEQNHKQWSDYGGGPDSSHFVALDQINKSNVSQLQVAWVYPTGDDHAYLFNPIVVDNVMYRVGEEQFAGRVGRKPRARKSGSMRTFRA